MAASGHPKSVLRVGWGSQSRRFAAGLPLHLGGCAIAHERGLGGRLAGDVVCHSTLEALLSACGLPNYELLFGEDEEPADVEPLVVLAQTATGLYRQRLQSINNVVVKLSTREPELSLYRTDMLLQLASALQLQPDQVTVNIEQDESLLADLPAETVRAQTSLACSVGPVLRPQKSAAHPSLQETMDYGDPPAAVAEEPEEYMPPRAREFEKAVKSKLPPLPKAEAPKPGDMLIVYTDGASRGNPGPAASGWVVFNDQGLLVHEKGDVLGRHTNNQAEYKALQSAVQWIEQNLGREFALDLRLDSELVVKQLRGEYKIKDAGLKQLAMEVMNTLMYFDSFTLTYIPREQNSRADALANRALDESVKSPKH